MANDVIFDYMNELEKIYESTRNENPYVSFICGDFNARNPVFWEEDSINNAGRSLNDLLVINNLQQLISEPTHIRDDGSQSCIDLICTDQPSLFIESGVLPSLDQCSKHNIIHGSVCIHLPPPPPYKRKIWDFKKADIDSIRRELVKINWQQLFVHLNVNEMSLLFTDVFLDVIGRYVPNQIVTFNEKDAPWVTPRVKTAIKRNARVYRKWIKRGRNPNDRENVCKIQNETNRLIKENKKDYYSQLGRKLSDPNIGQRHFWTAFKKLANKKINTNIPPVILGGRYVSNIKEKAGIFNDYFAQQCQIFDNGSMLPDFSPLTESLLSDITISKESIVSIINN